MSVSGSITVIAGAIAVLAAVRAVQLALRLDDERAPRLSRALVVHGAAVLVVGASAVLGGTLEWFTAVLVALAAGSWGLAWIFIGRSYDTDPARLEALRREERAARTTRAAAQRFERPRGAPGGAGERRHGEPSRRAR